MVSESKTNSARQQVKHHEKRHSKMKSKKSSRKKNPDSIEEASVMEIVVVGAILSWTLFGVLVVFFLLAQLSWSAQATVLLYLSPMAYGLQWCLINEVGGFNKEQVREFIAKAFNKEQVISSLPFLFLANVILLSLRLD